MKPNRQQEEILKLHRGGEWICSTAYEYIRDHRKRISELNEGYLKERGYQLVGKRCDGRCGKKHSSTLFMRRAEKIETPTTIVQSDNLPQTMEDYWNSLPAHV